MFKAIRFINAIVILVFSFSGCGSGESTSPELTERRLEEFKRAQEAAHAEEMQNHPQE
jgi:hypothetical protein